MLDSLLHFDQDLFLYLNGLGSEKWDPFWLFITNKWGSIPLYFFLLILSIKAFSKRELLLYLLFIVLLVTFTDQFTNLAKNTFDRLRPCFEPELDGMVRLVKEGCGYQYGYFSAHATNTFGVALFFISVLGRTYRWMVVPLLLWASVVSYSRIYVGVHYPLDVFSGIVAGIIIGLIFGKIYFWAKNKLNS